MRRVNWACGGVSSRFSVVRWRIGLRQYLAHRLEEPEARALVAAGKSASYGLGKTQTRSGLDPYRLHRFVFLIPMPRGARILS